MVTIKSIGEFWCSGRYKIPKEFVKVENGLGIVFKKEIAIFMEQHKRAKFLYIKLDEKDQKKYSKYLKDLNKKILEQLPLEARKELKKWEIINKSPYSNSFYNVDNITWGNKPINSLRLSDHWNFESCGDIHCRVKGVNSYLQKWLLCKFNGNEYEIIKEF